MVSMRSVDPIQPLRAERMAQSPLGKVLGHLAKMAERQGQLHQVQNEVLTELAQSLAADRAPRLRWMRRRTQRGGTSNPYPRPEDGGGR
jgi:hypothetical protein